jgi:hypothetical protein
MYNWEKIGQVFDPTKSGVGDWMREYAQTPSTLIFSDFVRIYFCCRPLPVDGLYVSHLAYIDVRKNNLLDIIDISKRPIMNLGQTGTFDEFGIYPASVIRHENDIRVYYGGNTRCRSVPFNAAIGVGVSDDDGRTFKRLGPGPVLSYSYDEPFTLKVSGIFGIRPGRNGWSTTVLKFRCTEYAWQFLMTASAGKNMGRTYSKPYWRQTNARRVPMLLSTTVNTICSFPTGTILILRKKVEAIG